MWDSHPDFWAVVHNAWQKDFHGSPMFILVKKLQHTKAILKQWNRCVFGYVQQQLQTGRATLEATQNALLINPLNPSLISSKAQAKLAFLDLLRVEESFLRQKSRQLWLSDCDKNSLFFHSMVKYRIARNSIRTVQLQDGSFSLNPSTIKSHTVDFFKALHNTQCTVPIPKSPPMISLSDSEQVALCVAVSDDEIKATLFSLKPLSSPGLDGFSAAILSFISGMAGAREVHFDNGRLRIEA
ncbi:hypothetical protein QJS10_CPA07g00449 [Acorus calamus]|uniref:Uncharacterized protein n=1 Tax=Acorus calamus TaxID=4465 RepID=A0AAV9EFZ2_ACOCL|nr:hypothetical protein QJS10_CPA07g00449 [Acorus calamus]